MEEARGAASAPASVTEVRVGGLQPLRLLEWKVAAGSAVRIGSVLAVCAPGLPAPRPGPGPAPPPRKLKAERPGVVRELCAQRGQLISPG